MDDSIMADSIFDAADSSDFAPPVKAKIKAAPKPAAKKVTKEPKAAPKPKKTAQTTSKTTKPKPAASKKRPKPDTEDEDSEPDAASLHDASLLSATPPSAKKQKKAPAPKKAAGKPLQPRENEAAQFDGSPDPKPTKKTTATEQYQKLTQLEHIIKRPDTYIGSVERTEAKMWVYNTELDSMEMRDIIYVPGLYKIFDEILVNAADNKQRDKNMDCVKVTVDRENGQISVWNNGRGIPIEIHEKERIYIPEMIFGHLLTGSNYDDDQEKVTGGRNGYGAKLCNIFSTKFTLETADSKTKKKYKQTWTDNMSKMGAASITDNKEKDDYTKITFAPDFKKFKMDGMEDDLEALLKRRVYDLAGTCRGVKVYLNGTKIKLGEGKSGAFKKYMEMYTKAIKRERGEEAANDTSEIITESPDPRWEVGFAVSDGTFQQVSFVNSIATTSGGTHVNYIADQVCNKLIEIVKKKNKGGPVLKPAQIRNHIFIFVNCLIVNPAFTSQTKEQLTTKASQFGSKCIVSEDFLKKIAKTDVVTNILAFAEQKADQILKKSDGARRSRMDNPKLTDANRAGTKDGYQCTLILTEGDSAKALAMAGRSVVGPDLFGVFPLRGKLLNVRDASVDQVSKNSEIQNIKNILGLKHKQVYTDCKSLRYGHIMIMTDQDHDGSHIKGLLINFFQVSYPSLLKIPQFLIEFITPIVKVFKGNPKQPTKMKSFFTMPEYEAWKEAHQHERGWEHKYYKGLGTSTTEEAQVYFKDLDKHLKDFHVMQENEPELIELAFSKKKADERKEWLRQFKPGTYMDHSTKEITYTDFVNRELILFSMADNMRSIPCVIDGLKPGQRKILYTCFKRNIRKDVKVSELSGMVSAATAYHHGDVSLQQTIVGLGQDFVGSNNLICLEPSGNFGSRLQGGSDAASARYIFTRLSPFARKVFSPLDEPLLKYNTDDDKTIEPEMYVPIVPLVLINGADGIGTGWSSSIPNYNPEDVVENLKLMMDGHEPKPMTPWFRDFKGEVTQIAADRYKFSGVIKQTGENEVEITELPIRTWTQDFKDKLVEIIKAEKTPSWIKEYDDYNTHKNVHFIVRLEDKFMKQALDEGLEEKFKLTKTIATSNLVAFDREGRITKYATVEDILKEFYAVRIRLYEKRKEYQLAEYQRELDKFTNQARFIQMIIDGKLIVSKKQKKVLVAELKAKNFKPIPKTFDASKEGETEPVVDENADQDEDVEAEASAYDYLLGMPIWSLTKERVDRLLQQMGDKEAQIDALIKLSKEDIWKKELKEFIDTWRFQLEEEKALQKKVANLGRRASAKLKTAKSTASRKRKGDESDFDSDFNGGKPAKKAAIAKKDKPVSKPKQTLLSDFAPSIRPPAPPPSKPAEPQHKDVWMEGLDDSDAPVAPKPKAVAKPIAPVKKGPAAKPPKPVKIDSDFDDDDEPVVPKGKAPAANGRAPRAAARKPAIYTLNSDSESDNGDDMLFDVGNMVKGLNPPPSSETAPARPLFSDKASASRPGSSAGLGLGRKSVSRGFESDSNDETDYKGLASGGGNFRAPVKRAGLFSDDENDEPVVVKKPLEKKKPVVKEKEKVKAVPAAQKEPVQEKRLVLSPAAKAYAAKQTKANGAGASKPAVKAKAKTDFSDDDDDDDDLMEIDSRPVAKVREASVVSDIGGRPSRRAAAAKPKAWIVEDDEDEESESAVESGSEDFDDSD